MAKPLTARAVDALKDPGRYPVGEGLYLIVDGGSRRWFYRFQIDGRRREMGLGPYPTVSLKEARDLASAAKRSARSGIDPVEARKSTKPVVPTFGSFADTLVSSLELGFRSEKHRYQWKQTLGEAYCAAIRDKLVSEITTEDVLSVLSPIWTTKSETASRLRGRIERVLNAATAKNLRSGPNPAAWRGHLSNLLPARRRLTRGHQPALPFEAVPAFVSRLRQRDAVSARALEFLILTASRAGEVFGARWQEIDMANRLWIVPASRMKAGKEHRVPLVERALAILHEMAQFHTDADPDAFVFRGARTGRPLSNMAFAALLDRMNETGFVPHGFRSSFRDWAGECTSFPREAAEAALAHIIGSEVERAYRRRDSLEKRRELMTAWAAFVDGGDGDLDAPRRVARAEQTAGRDHGS